MKIKILESAKVDLKEGSKTELMLNHLVEGMRVIWFRSTALIMNKKYYLTCQIATRIVHV